MRLCCSASSASAIRAIEALRLSNPLSVPRQSQTVSRSIRTRGPAARLASVALLCAVGVSLAGCGGGDSAPSMADYTVSVVSTRNRVDGVLARVTQAQSKDELLKRMDEAAVVIDDSATELDEGGAAEGFEDATSQLVDALHQLSTDLGAFAHDARQPGGEALLLGGPGLNFESWTQANEVLENLMKQGIDVEPIGRH